MRGKKSERATARLSRRARQVLEAVYRLERASAAEVQAALSDPPSYSAVRTHLRILEERGHVKHVSEGPRYVYMACVPKERASRGAVRHLVDTFFEGSVAQAVAALLASSKSELSDEEIARLETLIQNARDESTGKPPHQERPAGRASPEGEESGS